MLLVASVHGARVVSACCQRALTHGVQPGDSLATARSRCNGQAVEADFDAAADARALANLACWCLRYGPRSVVERSPGPHALCVQVTGCEQVHGGWPQLLARVQSDMRRLRLHATAAVAGSTAAALVAAVHTPWQVMEDDALAWCADAPLSLLRMETQVVQALHEMGVRTIGQCAQLPAGGLADRFGAEPWRRMQLALGRVAERLPSTVQRGAVRAAIDFDGPTSQAEAVRQATMHCVHQLADKLLRKRLGTRHLRVRLARASAPPTVFEVRLARASRRGQHLWRLVQPHIERVHLGHDPSQGVEGVQVRSLLHVSLGLGQWRLIEGAAALEDGADPGWGEWLDQVRRRLGAASVRRPHAQADPDDARAWQARVAEGSVATPRAPDMPVDALAALRPCVRVAPAQPIEVECDARRRPVRVWLQRQWLVVQAHDGPERVSAAWWRGERGVQDRWRVLAGDTWWWLRRQGAAWWLEGAWT